MIREALSLNNLCLNDIKLFTIHNCNIHLWKVLIARLNISEDKFYFDNHHKYSHCMNYEMLFNYESIASITYKGNYIISLSLGAGGFDGCTLIRK
tara:strand:- start:1511 stop:1795 length:285 start_codon:yes stop_codon:yes gene_type:complete